MSGKIVVIPEELRNRTLFSYKDHKGMKATAWLRYIQKHVLDKGHDAYYSHDKFNKIYFYVVIDNEWYEVPTTVVTTISSGVSR